VAIPFYATPVSGVALKFPKSEHKEFVDSDFAKMLFYFFPVAFDENL
jgi:hypothetical protein